MHSECCEYKAADRPTFEKLIPQLRQLQVAGKEADAKKVEKEVVAQSRAETAAHVAAVVEKSAGQAWLKLQGQRDRGPCTIG